MRRRMMVWAVALVLAGMLGTSSLYVQAAQSGSAMSAQSDAKQANMSTEKGKETTAAAVSVLRVCAEPGG